MITNDKIIFIFSRVHNHNFNFRVDTFLLVVGRNIPLAGIEG